MIEFKDRIQGRGCKRSKPNPTCLSAKDRSSMDNESGDEEGGEDC